MIEIYFFLLFSYILEKKTVNGFHLKLPCQNFIGSPTIHFKTTREKGKRDIGKDDSIEWVEIASADFDCTRVNDGVMLAIKGLTVGSRYLYRILLEEDEDSFISFINENLLKAVGKLFIKINVAVNDFQFFD